MGSTPLPRSNSRGDVAQEPDVRESPLEVRPPTPDALCIETPLSALDTPITPTSRFFVRNHFATPEINVESWRLVIEGDVERPQTLTYAEFRALPHKELAAVLECAGNSRSTVRPKPEGVLWRNGAVGTARWTGVPLAALLDRAGVRAGAIEVLFEGLDHGTEPGVEGELNFGMSVTLEKARDPETLIADEMNGEPLTPRHGFPVRAVVPGWYGMASVKWLSRIVVLRHPFRGYFRARAYAFIMEGEKAEALHRPVTTVRVKSLITSPKEGQILDEGVHRIRGVAWSGAGGIARVEVSVGGLSESLEEETWHAATLREEASPHAWTHWEFSCSLSRPGFYVVRVRATDERGNVQPFSAKWNYRGLGNNSVHEVPIEVRRS